MCAIIGSLACFPSLAEEPISTNATDWVELVSPMGGVCSAVFVTPGQEVQRGERLLAIVPADGNDTIEPLREQVLMTADQFENLRSYYLKTLQEFQRGAVATSVVEQARADMEAAGTFASESRTRLQRAEHSMRPVFIYSPGDATVNRVHATASQPIEQDDILISLKVKAVRGSDSQTLPD